jgi:hypothetical protein
LGHDEPIDEGTSCRAATPAPGPVPDVLGPRWLTAQPAASSIGRNDPAGHRDLGPTVETFPPGDSTSALEQYVLRLLGPQTFGLGVLYGMGENVAGRVIDVSRLARTLLLADLYDRAHAPALVAMVGPFGGLHRLVAELSMGQFGRELQEARDERDALIAEVMYAVTNPREVFGNIADSYVEKWNRFEAASAQRTLSGQFEAGRIVGDVLVDVVALIGTGVVVAKAASKIPRLLRLVKKPKALGVRGAGSVKAPPAPREAPLTPSQAAGQVRAAQATDGVKVPSPASQKAAPQTAAQEPGRRVRGASSNRPFDSDRAGGPILKLSTKGVKITHRGIDVLERHIARFGPDKANEFMVKRLRAIANGELAPTQYDMNYYTHELREFARYRKLGWETGRPAHPDAAHELWENAHTATLEDYRLKDSELYHPDAPLDQQ